MLSLVYAQCLDLRIHVGGQALLPSFRVWQVAKGRQHLSRRWLWHPAASGDAGLDILLHAPPDRALHLPAGVPHPPHYPFLPALHSHGCLACSHTLTQLHQGLRIYNSRP